MRVRMIIDSPQWERIWGLMVVRTLSGWGRGLCVLSVLTAWVLPDTVNSGRRSFLSAADKPAATAAAAEETATAHPRQLLLQSRRVLLLGDSITASGRYAAFFEAWLFAQRLERQPHLICAGLSSETVSGLSEEGHAGGKFPRPDLAERLDRVLRETKPDLVFCCYGINCGIYQPFDAERFAAYQRGLGELKAKVEKAGGKLIVITPPMHDERRPNQKFSYNEVLDRYSAWLLGQRQQGWLVIDLHDPMTREVKRRRESDPKFTMQPDAVHPNDEGHWFITQQLIRYFGDEASAKAESPQAMLALHKVPAEMLPLVQQRVNLLRDAYVGAAGHKRPGVAAGLPVVEAEQKGRELEVKIRALLAK